MKYIFDERWRRQDGARMRETMEKVKGGIIQRLYVNDVLVLKTFSPRPYVLGQACDGTIDSPVFALFYSFCKAKGLNPNELYKKAYGEEQIDWSRIIKEAKIQGVKYPKRWSKKEYEGLSKSLTEINNHLLVNILDEVQSEILQS